MSLNYPRSAPMLLPLRPPVLRAHIRLLHASVCRAHLVAPPDAVSHMRPIIYHDSPDSLGPSSPTLLRHPYSLSEFSNTSGNDHAADLELQFHLQRQQLDAFNHNFWLDSNSRFEAAKQAILSTLPESATTLDKEHALSEFYKQWITQEKLRTDAYTSEWRRRNIALIMLDFRVHLQKLTSRFNGVFSSSPKHQKKL